MILAIAVSSPTFSDTIVMDPSFNKVAPMTFSSLPFSTGMDSPVIADSSKAP